MGLAARGAGGLRLRVDRGRPRPAEAAPLDDRFGELAKHGELHPVEPVVPHRLHLTRPYESKPGIESLGRAVSLGHPEAKARKSHLACPADDMLDERSTNAMAPPDRIDPHGNQLGLVWRLGGNSRNQA